MRTIVLVGCGKEKRAVRSQAKDLYVGPLFKKARAFAESQGCEWRILSAKYGLVDPEEMIDPYDETMEKKTKLGRNLWNITVRNAVASRLLKSRHVGGGKFFLEAARFICLAGEAYLGFFDIDPEMRKRCVIEKPMEGLGIGERLQYLGENLL